MLFKRADGILTVKILAGCAVHVSVWGFPALVFIIFGLLSILLFLANIRVVSGCT